MFDRGLDSYRWWWCALSGLLLVACFEPFACATCGWIALIPAWWVLTRSERVRRRPFRHGYLVGLIYFGGVFWWICNVTAVGAFFLILYLALYPALWFWLVARLVVTGPVEPASDDRSLRPLWQAISAAALWVLLEWCRSVFLTGFNWNELGISQAPSIIFRQLAAYGGVPLISFVLAMVNVLWAEGLLSLLSRLRQKPDVRQSLGRLDSLFLASCKSTPLACALLLVAICFALGVHHLMRHSDAKSGANPRLLHYACIQPNIPEIPLGNTAWADFLKQEHTALDKMEKLSFEAISPPAKTDLLIWPEAILDETIFDDPDPALNHAVRMIGAAFDGYFLLGAQEVTGGGKNIYNSAYSFAPGGTRFEKYRKTKLVILGEYLPFGDTFPWLRQTVGMGLDMTPGPGPAVFTMTNPDLTYAPLICFEDTLPEAANKAVKLKPDFFITITNDGWYQGWCAGWGVRQHLDQAIFRCIEHDRPMIRCANTGISCQIDANGTVASRYQDATGGVIDVGGIFRGTLEIRPVETTFYETWGEWIVLISALISGILGLRLLGRLRAT